MKAGAAVVHMTVFRIMMKQQKFNESYAVDVAMLHKIQVGGDCYSAQNDELTCCLKLGRLFIVSPRSEPQKRVCLCKCTQ